MSRTVGFVIAGLLATGVVLCLSRPAWADAAGDYQTLFAEEEKAVAAKGAKAAPEFAAKLLTAAKSVGEQKDLQALLYEKAYEFGMKAPAGQATAIDAMKLLIEAAPDDQKAAAQDKLLAVLQLRYAKSTGDERKRLGDEMIDLLVAGGDARAEARQPSEAIVLYRRALEVAKTAQPARSKEIGDKIKDLAAAQEADKKVAALKARLDKDPTDVATRTSLVLAYLGELDDPAEAAKLLTADLDEGLRTYVPLAAKKIEDLEEAACIQLAEWFASIADKSAGAGKAALLGRAKEYCQQYLELHPAQDAAHLKAKMLLEKVDKAAGAAGGRQPKAAAGFVPLFNGKDLTGWKANGKATFVVKDGCIVGTEPAGDAGDLMTEKEFDNFEFRVTYRVVWPANTGFWFRTGYQYDILRYKNPVAYSGSLYGGSSGKLFVTTNTDESLENADGWNEARVWANGDHIILWLNGKKVGDCHDKAHAKGRFGIQVYGTKEFINMKVIVKRFDVRALKADEPAPTR